MSYKDNLLRVMEAKGVSQSELARRLRLSSQGVNQWFASDGEPPYQRLPKIAEALDVPVAQLLEGVTAPSDPLDVAANAPSAQTIRRSIGSRLNFVRTVRMLGDFPDVAARHLKIEPADLLAYEAGEQPLLPEDIVSFCGVFGVSADFLLLGKRERLDESLHERLPKKAHT
jgi:transcriptional regulator with XRE-family HTH domain